MAGPIDEKTVRDAVLNSPQLVVVNPTILPCPTPDWPPRDSAWRFDEGTLKYGSTGQLFEVRHRRWVRVPGAQQQ